MRGGEERSGSLSSYVDLEARVGKSTIRASVNEALAALAGEFSALYSLIRRSSIPPEKLVRATKSPRIPAARLGSAHAAKAMHSNMMFADRP
jgi:hypothetical protein